MFEFKNGTIKIKYTYTELIRHTCFLISVEGSITKFKLDCDTIRLH